MPIAPMLSCMVIMYYMLSSVVMILPVITPSAMCDYVGVGISMCHGLLC